MMNKKERSEYLLLSIGEVDDRLLQEAVCYRAEKRQLSFKPYELPWCLLTAYVGRRKPEVGILSSALCKR